MASIFEVVRGISARDAAERRGIRLVSKGSKTWACCPLHGEKTESMCFYSEGTWYCFGCHKGGDAVRLYEELLNCTPLEAAMQLASDFGIQVDDAKDWKPEPPKPTVYDLERALEKRRSKEWSYLCDAVHKADAILDKYSHLMDAAWDNDEFVNALRARTYANMRLDWLWQASLVDLALEYRESKNEQDQ